MVVHRYYLDKCEILALHDCPIQEFHNIQEKTEVKYLGICISKDMTTTDNKNVWNKVDECKKLLKSFTS